VERGRSGQAADRARPPTATTNLED